MIRKDKVKKISTDCIAAKQVAGRKTPFSLNVACQQFGSEVIINVHHRYNFGKCINCYIINTFCARST